MKTFKDVVVGDRMHCIIGGRYEVLPVIDIKQGSIEQGENKFYIILDNGSDEHISIVGFNDDTSVTYCDCSCDDELFYISKKELMTKLNFDWFKAEEKTQKYILKGNKAKNLIKQIKES